MSPVLPAPEEMERTNQEVREALETPVEKIDVARLMPIFVPADFVGARWCGPYQPLRNMEISMTWCVLMRGRVIRYVDDRMAAHWRAIGLDWPALAMRNLMQRSKGPGITRVKGSRGVPIAVVLYFPDGLGPSRLLFCTDLSKFFPSGYQVAVPDRTCALALAKDLEEPDRGTIRRTIAEWHQKGPQPFSPNFYEPDHLQPHGPVASGTAPVRLIHMAATLSKSIDE